jgi:hypothetical protein
VADFRFVDSQFMPDRVRVIAPHRVVPALVLQLDPADAACTQFARLLAARPLDAPVLDSALVALEDQVARY